VGGGMLALPVSTGPSGFFPSLTLLLICWAFMTTTALLLLEVNLWMAPGSHIISMTSRFLGPVGKAVSWLIFLFVGYASLVAYITGGGELMAEALSTIMQLPVTKWMGCFVFIAVFGLLIDQGAALVGRVNAIFVGAMVITYLALVGLGLPKLTPEYLMHQEWTGILKAAPIVLTVFSFQCIVPSITIYLEQNVKALRMAIIAGTTITLAVYILWELLVLGTVPIVGTKGLLMAYATGDAATEFYREAVGNRWISLLAGFFAFFALATSFLGIGLSLFDFLADGLKMAKTGWRKWFLALLIMGPSLFFALNFERAFLVALDVSGGFGDAILNGIIPALMVWIGRYRLKMTSQFSMPGGRLLLIGVIAIAGGVVLLEILQMVGYL
jgi:tyrosine-specific transport protein